ncbi:MAG: septal ring lytic transglycosylase RlpA family protein [Hyphomicrobiaceae bacterium]
MILRLNDRKIGLMTVAATLAMLALPHPAEAKRPGKRHCFGGVCHRVMTLAETEREIGKPARMTASYYDDCHRDRFNPCGLTSSGETFRPHLPDNAASAIHPDGTILVVRNPATGLAAVVRVNNFGPFHADRKIDVSRATAERLGFSRVGIASLEVMVAYAPSHREARYERRRRYDPVPGFIGSAPSIATAYDRYAALTRAHRIAKLDRETCRVARNRRTPPLDLIASLAPSYFRRLARS